MAVALLPKAITDRYQVEERRHAIAILKTDFPNEYNDVIDCLSQFELLRSEVIAGGGGKSKIANRFDQFLDKRGWKENELSVSRQIGAKVVESQTHKVDRFKSRIALEIEWNNKDPFYSRDLGAFRLFHELGEISIGIIVTRSDELQALFDTLGYVKDKHGKWQRVGSKYGASTTHWGKMMPMVESGTAGTCPLLLFGIRPACYRDDIPNVPVKKTAN